MSINFEKFGFKKIDNLDNYYIKHCYDWVAIAGPVIHESVERGKHKVMTDLLYKWQIDISEKTMYNKSEEVRIGRNVASIKLINDDELLEWLTETNIDIPETVRVHELMKNMECPAYVKHKIFDSPNGFMIKTGNTKFNIIEDKKCELMIGANDEYPEGLIIEASTYDLIPTYVKLPALPLRIGTVIKENDGPIKKDNIKGCHDGECIVIINEKINLPGSEYKVANKIANSLITVSEHLELCYLDILAIGKPKDDIKNYSGFFSFCPTCGAKIQKDVIQKRVERIHERIKEIESNS